jgi:hypothetical protein
LWLKRATHVSIANISLPGGHRMLDTNLVNRTSSGSDAGIAARVYPVTVIGNTGLTRWTEQLGELLPPVFADINLYESDDDAVINQGGAAMAAYGRLQLEHVKDDIRQCWRDALLKYCELDTLAMAMIVQGWRAWLK